MGKQVFVGIDVHRLSYSISCLLEKELVFQGKFPADKVALVEFLTSRFKGSKLFTAYEAGFSGFVLHRYLEANGITNIVVNASSVEISARDRVKTDKRDSLKLATQLADSRLRSIAIPTLEQERKRLVTRTRAQLIKERTRIRNQLRMKLNQFDYLPSGLRGVLTYPRAAEIIKSVEETELVVVASQYLQLWKVLETRIRRLDTELSSQAKADKLEKTYRSASGIGKVAARVLSNELGDMSRFPNERSLFSYTGLTPTEYSSGEKRRLGHISRQGSSRLRAILIECAWTAIKQDSKLKTDFERIASRAGSKRAIVAVARKLIGRIRAAFRKGELYQPGHSTALA
jgi:transposase